jgi:hypothetical protein
MKKSRGLIPYWYFGDPAVSWRPCRVSTPFSRVVNYYRLPLPVYYLPLDFAYFYIVRSASITPLTIVSSVGEMMETGCYLLVGHGDRYGQGFPNISGCVINPRAESMSDVGQGNGMQFEIPGRGVSVARSFPPTLNSTFFTRLLSETAAVTVFVPLNVLLAIGEVMDTVGDLV